MPDGQASIASATDRREPTEDSRAPEGVEPLANAAKGLPALIASQLRHSILVGELAPGTRLHQSDLAKQFGVSTTPVREAIKLLTAQGLVDSDTFVGAAVHRPTHEDLTDRYEIRLALNPLSVRSSIQHITDADLERARHLQHLMQIAPSLERWLINNRDFHRVLDDAIAPKHLARLMCELADVSDFYIFLSLPYRRTDRIGSLHEHEEIMQAYETRNVDRAIRATTIHLTATYEACVEALQGSPALATSRKSAQS